MRTLEGWEKTKLRGLAHHLHPVVQVGKQGLTDGVVTSVADALDRHELIKVKFVDFKEERKTLAEDIAGRSDSVCVGMVGNVAIFYREQPDKDKRRIKLTPAAG